MPKRNCHVNSLAFDVRSLLYYVLLKGSKAPNVRVVVTCWLGYAFNVVLRILYKEKQWAVCVQSDIRDFGMAGVWKATALKAEVWVETATEGGRRFMATWRKEEVGAARHRQEKREATRLGNLLSHTEA